MAGDAAIRTQADALPEGDVIRILLEQHARIRDLFRDVAASTGDEKQSLFDQLRALLAVHETAEEMILRPVSKPLAGGGIADARNQEESDATELLVELEKLDASSEAFDAEFAAFRQSVDEHANSEEREEFPVVVTQCDEGKRRSMGTVLRRVESLAPTYPHPSTAGSTAAQWVGGPFMALVDRARAALSRDMADDGESPPAEWSLARISTAGARGRTPEE